LLHAKSELDLSFKGIDDQRAKQFAKELADNTTVVTLILSRNEVPRLLPMPWPETAR
jgi:hypothetical protein